MAHYTARVLDSRRLELPKGALNLIRPGQEIEIDIEDLPSKSTSPGNEAGLQMLADLDRMQRDMPESDPSKTDELIREARSGGAYGV